MTRHQVSYDANHAEIAAVLRALPHIRVLDLARLGAPYDLLVLAPSLAVRGAWRAVLMDVKISAKAPLTPAQRTAADEGWLTIVMTADEALDAVERARAV